MIKRKIGAFIPLPDAVNFCPLEGGGKAGSYKPIPDKEHKTRVLWVKKREMRGILMLSLFETI